MMSNPVEILQKLHVERQKFTKSDRELMELLVSRLVEMGVYPKCGGGTYKYPALKMVECYGVDWHQFDAPHFCSECHSDLRSWDTGPPYKREIYVKSRDREFQSYYQCPDCKANITAHVAASRCGNSTVRKEQ